MSARSHYNGMSHNYGNAQNNNYGSSSGGWSSTTIPISTAPPSNYPYDPILEYEYVVDSGSYAYAGGNSTIIKALNEIRPLILALMTDPVIKKRIEEILGSGGDA